MQPDSRSTGGIVSMFLAAGALATTALAQVEVNNGQTLTKQDLRLGTFAGQEFLLSPTTVFEVNQGGVFGPMQDWGAGNPIAVDHGGATVNINDGGLFASDFTDSSGPDGPGSTVGNAIVNLNPGGRLGTVFRAASGSTVNLLGGRVGSGFMVLNGAELNITGGEFQLGGTPVTALPDGLSTNEPFTGTLADGSVFILSREHSDSITAGGVTLQPVPLPPADPTPMVIDSEGSEAKGLRPGQTLTLRGDGRLVNDFAAVGATLNIEGGVVGRGLETVRTTVNISGGRVEGRQSLIYNDPTGFTALEGTVVNMTGGEVARWFNAARGSVVRISGGRVDEFFTARSGSTVELSGGNVGNSLRAQSGSEILITGSEFLLDGAPLPDLRVGEPREVTARGAGLILTGRLVDGSPFEFELNGVPGTGTDFFDPAATLILSVEPVAGDLDGDGFIGAGDLDILLGVWNQNDTGVADLTGDGFIGAGDLDLLLGNWNAGSPPAAVLPEPATVALLGLGGLLFAGRQ